VAVELSKPVTSPHRSAVGAGSPIVLTAAVLIGCQLALRGWAVYAGWLQGDDFVFITKALHDDLSLPYLFQSYAGHLMPGGFLLSWVMASTGPLDHDVYATVLLVMQAVASIGMFRLLRSMFGDRWAIVPLLAVYLFSVISLPAFVWWAAAINQLPVQIALFFGVHAHLQYLRTRRLRHLSAALAWSAFGLFFCEKALIVFVAYLVIGVTYFATGNMWQRVRSIIASYWPGVIGYGILAGGYVSLYVGIGWELGTTAPNKPPFWSVALSMIGEAFSTGVTGGPWRWTPLEHTGAIANPHPLQVVLALVALAVLVEQAATSRRRSLRAWWLLILIAAFDVITVAFARAAFVGSVIGFEYRYQTELSAVAALCTGLAFLPLRGARASAEPTESGSAFDIAEVTVLATTLFVAVAAVSNIQYARLWHGDHFTRQYLSNVKDGLSAAPIHPVPMVDGAVPDSIVWRLVIGYNTYSTALAPLSAQMVFPRVTEDLFMLDESGQVRPVVIKAVAMAKKRAGGCGYRIGRHPVRIPLVKPAPAWDWWIRIGYIANHDSAITIDVAGRSFTVPIKAQLHALFLHVDDEMDALTFSGFDDGTAMCTNDIVIGSPLPFEPPP
jgi:hypothetical protein